MIKILNKTGIVRIVSFQTSLCKPLDPRHYTSRPSFQMSDVESRMSDVGCQISDVGCRISDVGCRISDVRCRMSNLRYQMSDVKSGMSDLECRMSNVGWHLQASLPVELCILEIKQLVYIFAVKIRVVYFRD